MTIRSLRASACWLTAAAAILWAVIIAGMWVTVPERDMRAAVPAAPTASILAGMLWITSGNRRRDETRGILIDTVVNLTRPASRRPTGPLRRVQ